MKQIGIIYIEHLDRPLNGRNQHYAGWTPFGRLRERDQEHHSGIRTPITRPDGSIGHTGAAAILAEAVRRGIDFQISRCFIGTRDDERRLKSLKTGFAKYCPICNPDPKSLEFVDDITVEQALNSTSTRETMKRRRISQATETRP